MTTKNGILVEVMNLHANTSTLLSLVLAGLLERIAEMDKQDFDFSLPLTLVVLSCNQATFVYWPSLAIIFRFLRFSLGRGSWLVSDWFGRVVFAKRGVVMWLLLW